MSPQEGESDGVAHASAADLLDLRWQVLRAGRPRTSAHLPGDDASGTRHWALRHGGEVVACATVMETPYPFVHDDHPLPLPLLRLRGMAVRHGLQGQGLGSRLLRAVQAELGAPLWCDARVAAVPFYAAHGWEIRTPPYDVPEVGLHHRMRWPGPA